MAWLGPLPERLDVLYVAPETDILLLSDDLRRLVDACKERGSVLQSELNDVLEPLSVDPLEADSCTASWRPARSTSSTTSARTARPEPPA